MIQLKENAGISVGILTAMAVIAGFTVANCYYNQPLLELIRADLHVSEAQANLITVITQIGYAIGLFFIIPMGDLYSRRRIVMVNMLVAALMAVVIATAGHIAVVWGASLIIGACSVVPQIFIPIAGQFSEPANKSRNIGIVLSGLLTGILASRVVSGYVGNWLGWRPMFFIAAVLMVVCMGVTLMVLPDMKRNFEGRYAALMKSLWQIVCGQSPHTPECRQSRFRFRVYACHLVVHGLPSRPAPFFRWQRQSGHARPLWRCRRPCRQPHRQICPPFRRPPFQSLRRLSSDSGMDGGLRLPRLLCGSDFCGRHC